MADEFGEKTEQPTDRRRSDSREKGNVARSTDLNAAAHLLAAAAAIAFLGIPVVNALGEMAVGYWSQPGWLRIDIGGVTGEFFEIARTLAGALFPWLSLMFVVALGVNLAQVGFLLSPEAVQPKLSRINPLQGAQRIFSIQAIVKLAGSLAKLIVLTVIAGLFTAAQLPALIALSGNEPPAILLAIKSSMSTLGFQLAGALVVLALLDFAYQKWKFERDLRMTKQEVRDEMKQMEGDPMIRHRRREAHRKLAQARELSNVAQVDVVITNPTHIAVALKYRPEEMDAPTVVAKGMGEIAARIRAIAVEHRIPIIERKELARALYRDVKVGRPVPMEMYEVFVEIMAYVYRISGRKSPDLR
ncbi:MAG: flagellar biosynthesis protein FlhB [Planctomycetaceae bacterium]